MTLKGETGALEIIGEKGISGQDHWKPARIE